jgi:hypothetical protein
MERAMALRKAVGDLLGNGNNLRDMPDAWQCQRSRQHVDNFEAGGR